MSHLADHLMRCVLSKHAGYAEKQLIKAGDLGGCAARVIRRQRKLLYLYYGIVLTFVLPPVIFHFAAQIFSPELPSMWNSVVAGLVLAMTQLPMIFWLQTSLARLEAITGAWLLNRTDNAGQEADQADMELAELLASKS